MKVNQYTNISYEFSDDIIVNTNETKRYEIDISQEQLDIIVAVMGSVVGLGKIRKLTDSIYEGLEKYSTDDGDLPGGQREMSYYFEESEIRSLPDKPKTTVISIENHSIKVTFDENNKPTKVELI